MYISRVKITLYTLMKWTQWIALLHIGLLLFFIRKKNTPFYTNKSLYIHCYFNYKYVSPEMERQLKKLNCFIFILPKNVLVFCSLQTFVSNIYVGSYSQLIW